MSDKAVITCALTGVLTDPTQHRVPVTPAEMAREAKAAFEAGAAIMHVHFRQQAPGKGHLPSWDPNVAADVMQAIREACPGVILNETTGTLGPDISGPVACLRAVKPEIAACNAGSLNYLKVRADGSWAWPPHLFDNPVEKVKAYLEVMRETGTQPEFECFDVGIVRCVGMYAKNGMFAGLPRYNFVMGVVVTGAKPAVRSRALRKLACSWVSPPRLEPLPRSYRHQRAARYMHRFNWRSQP
jgi:3-keto-5-aminohexanoate cleavage enzyme